MAEQWRSVCATKKSQAAASSRPFISLKTITSRLLTIRKLPQFSWTYIELPARVRVVILNHSRENSHQGGAELGNENENHGKKLCKVKNCSRPESRSLARACVEFVICWKVCTKQTRYMWIHVDIALEVVNKPWPPTWQELSPLKRPPSNYLYQHSSWHAHTTGQIHLWFDRDDLGRGPSSLELDLRTQHYECHTFDYVSKKPTPKKRSRAII